MLKKFKVIEPTRNLEVTESSTHLADTGSGADYALNGLLPPDKEPKNARVGQENEN